MSSGLQVIAGLALVFVGGWMMYSVITGSVYSQTPFTPSQLQTINNLACSAGISFVCPTNSTTNTPLGNKKTAIPQ